MQMVGHQFKSNYPYFREQSGTDSNYPHAGLEIILGTKHYLKILRSGQMPTHSKPRKDQTTLGLTFIKVLHNLNTS